MVEEPGLKPCPFCLDGKTHIDEYERFVCDSCGVVVKFPNSQRQEENARHGLVINNYDIEWHTSRWNQRAERTCKLGEPSTYYPVHLMTCSYCGKETQESSYCSRCGAKVVG